MGEFTAVVTGATGGLGGDVVRVLAEDGWDVWAPVRDPDGAAGLRRSLGDRVSRLTLRPADLTDPGSVERFFGDVAAAAPPVRALCNLVGGFAGGSLEDTDPATWDRLMALNVRSAFLCARAAIPLLRAAGGGSVVNVASATALGGVPGAAAYAASKAALVSLTRSLAEGLAGDGINVNAVAPGTIDTEGNRTAMPDADRSGWIAPVDIARVIRFLVGPDGRTVSGSVLRLPG